VQRAERERDLSSRSASPALKERNADDLLAEFVSAGGEEAFGEVVRRYAAMVFGVCLKVTGNAHDAEDATQATFLNLAVQLKSGKPVHRLGPWLQQVARRAALDVRRSRKRRQLHEQRHGEDRMHEHKSVLRDQGRNGHAVILSTNGKTSARASGEDIDLEKLNAVLAEELGRLPPKYRLPLMSLYFGQMERDEIAREMGLSVGTLGVRIHRGRQMLARRLSERGVAPAARLLSGNALALAISSVARANFTEHTAANAARIALGHDLAATTAANVLAALKNTAAAAVLAKLKGVAVVALLVTLSAAMAAAAGAAVRWDVVAPHVPQAVRNVVDWARGPWHLPLPRPAGPSVPAPISRAPHGRWEPRSVAMIETSRVPRPATSHPAQPEIPAGGAAGAAPPAAATPPPAPAGGPAPAAVAPLPVAARALPANPHLPQTFTVRPGAAPRERAAIRATPEEPTGAPQLRLGPDSVMTRTQRGTAVIGAPPIDADVTSPPPIDIGPGATLKLGDDTQSGNFVQPIAGFPRLWPPFSDGAPPAFAVGAGGNGSGTVRGWGGSVGNGGALINNGRIIADGKGQDRALIFGGYSSVRNTVDNPPGGHNGWFAENGGRLFLPKIPVAPGTHAYTWGESADDPQIDLVNSVRVTLHDAQAPGKLDISLLDKNRADVPTLPTGHTFIGVWSYDPGATFASGVDLTVRYDDGLAHRLGLNENVLKLWRYDGSQWVRILDGFSRDTDGNLLSGHVDGAMSFFAVSAPEPGALAWVGIAGALALLRRPR